MEQLAARCAEIGAPQLTVDALYLVENGRREPDTGRRRRKVTVDELLALALAFDMSPLYLLLPREEADVHLTSTVSRSAVKVFRWLVDEEPMWLTHEDGDQNPFDNPMLTHLRERPAYVEHLFARASKRQADAQGAAQESETERLLRIIAEKVGVDAKEVERGATDD